MKPFRLKLTHHLVLSYGLYKEMNCYRPHHAQLGEMTSMFHSVDYINFLKRIDPEFGNMRYNASQSRKYNVGPNEDCPAFAGLYEFSQLTTGASLDAAVQLCLGQTDIAINWAGGFHHAKKASASGFCYVNDIVLAICEMLKVYPRVLYVDIDVHHGDGVEEAFYMTDRVMTLSLHKYDQGFFPETGDIKDKGAEQGRGYSLNVPLSSGITDEQYFNDLFQPIFDKAIEVFQPGAIFLQCGADSLAADRLGTFNLTTRGHARMVDYVKSKNIPLLVSGGGGYTIRNVARVWCYETAVLLGRHDISNEIPFNDFYEYFAPTYDLHLLPEKMCNMNDKAKIDEIRTNLLQQLLELQGSPSVAMQEVPPLYECHEQTNDDENEDEGPNTRIKQTTKKQHPSELYDTVD
jgi:histone deacetylase 1/2